MDYYDNYCYLPLYCFSGSWPLIAKLRPSNIDPSLGTIEALEKIVVQIRKRFPDVQILLRADSGFMRDKILTWCEENGVKYVIGMARNNRLVGAIGKRTLSSQARI
jgi:predicted transcriptional regulator